MNPIAIAVALNSDPPAQSAITDYKVMMRQYWFAPPLANYPTERTYTIARFGDYVYSGTGLWAQAEQDALNAEQHWYGYRGAHQSSAADTGLITVTRANSKRATEAPNAAYMAMYTGCSTDDGSACSLGTDAAGNVGTAFLQLIGARVTITDNTAPALGALTAGQGLLASGTRSGDEPVTFNATDNVGIRRAELIDVTDAANPSVIAAKDYNATATAANTRCDFTKPKPCPDLKNETLASSPAIAGRHTLLLRVTDAAGNQTVSTPFAVAARGPVNGAGGGDGTRLVAGFPGHTFRGRGRCDRGTPRRGATRRHRQRR